MSTSQGARGNTAVIEDRGFFGIFAFIAAAILLALLTPFIKKLIPTKTN